MLTKKFRKKLKYPLWFKRRSFNNTITYIFKNCVCNIKYT